MLQGAAAGIRVQAAAFKEVRDNLSEGLRFYMSLQEAVTGLSQQIGDFCLTRRIQRCAPAPCLAQLLSKSLYAQVAVNDRTKPLAADV